MASARTVETRRLASPTIRALIQQRSAELTGLVLGLAGLALLVALACYDPRDPSLNTATSRHAGNLAGPAGAVLADLLLQGFGMAAALPGLAMLAWAWRIASRRGLGSVAARLATMLTALPVLAAVAAGLPAPPTFAWPTVAGLGGAIGRLLSSLALSVGHNVFGPVGALMVWTIGPRAGGHADAAGARAVCQRVARCRACCPFRGARADAASAAAAVVPLASPPPRCRPRRAARPARDAAGAGDG